MDVAEEQAACPAIAVAHLSKSIGRHRVLGDIILEIAAGELLVVLGLSGSGKTTLLRIIAGLDRADSGDVRLHGARATDMVLSTGDPVVVGLKDYRLLPHYPLSAESGAKALGE